jgi:hypothetical protein
VQNLGAALARVVAAVFPGTPGLHCGQHVDEDGKLLQNVRDSLLHALYVTRILALELVGTGNNMQMDRRNRCQCRKLLDLKV